MSSLGAVVCAAANAQVVTHVLGPISSRVTTVASAWVIAATSVEGAAKDRSAQIADYQPTWPIATVVTSAAIAVAVETAKIVLRFWLWCSL